MTEGVASLLIACLCYVFVISLEHPNLWLAILAGSISSLLLLTRGNTLVVVAATPLFMGLLARSAGATWPRTITIAGVCATSGAAVITPWAIRNCVLLEHFMPLGTQAGWNLPEGYSDRAIASAGKWTGQETAEIVARYCARDAAGPLAKRMQVYDPTQVEAVWPNDPKFARFVFFYTCGNDVYVEAEFARVGQNQAFEWVVAHPRATFKLVFVKVFTETRGSIPGFVLPVCGAVIAFVFVKRLRPSLTPPLFIITMVLAGVGLTHSVGGRFLVPLVPVVATCAAVCLNSLGRYLDSCGAMTALGEQP